MAQMPAAPILKEEAELKVLDNHIEILKAKLSFLMRSYDGISTNLLHQHEEKIDIVKKEILDAMEQRWALNRRRQIGIIR